MKSIVFLTPYKHLPSFKQRVEKNYVVKDASKFTDELKKLYINSSDIIFVAPNYINFTIKDSDLSRNKKQIIVSPSTGINHIEVSTNKIIHLKNDKILKNLWSTAEHNLYLILSITRNSGHIRELKSCNLGILGYGRLGKMLEKQTKNIFNSILKKDKDFCSNKFFTDTDFLSINIDLNKENENFIDKEFVSKFKKPIFIINTSRGEVVNEKEIIELLNEGKVLGYATDVVKEEHTLKHSILFSANLPNIFITDHIGGTAIETQEKAYGRVIDKLESFLNSYEQ
tara:strand:- start:5958 stop:6809 length:852 start_codon:yes stop_codon:yes gene_type:complete